MVKARFYSNRSEYDHMEEETTDSRLTRLAEKPDIWERMAEDDLYAMLRSMGTNERVIRSYQQKRVLQSALMLVIFGYIGYVTNLVLLYAVAIVSAFALYRSRYKSIGRMFQTWRFERELNFSKFVRLLIPYLKQSDGNVSLYSVFNKILIRLDNETDRSSLYMLMGEMGDRPGDIQPFNDFAERSSGSDMAYLIMATIFDYQESTKDISVINELGQMASEQMMSAIDDIILFKISRFGSFPTRITMTSFVLLIGFMIGTFLEQILTFLSI